MEYYFFLKDPHTEPEITVSNFPPTGKSNLRPVKNFISLAIPQEEKWHIRSVKEMEPFESYTVRASELDLSPQEMTQPLVFLSPQALEGRFEELPHFEGFSSSPAWRANLRIRSKESCVSYQGEYPGRMIDLKKGTLVSAGPLFQNNEGICNKVFIANFRREPTSARHRILIKRLQKRHEVMKKVDVYTNKVNYIDLSDIILNSEAEILLIISPDTACIPIYYSHSEDYRYLSLEHTHPPTEFTVFGIRENRFSLVENMKKFWLKAKPMLKKLREKPCKKSEKKWGW